MAAQQTAAPVDQELIVSLEVNVCQSVINPVYALYISLILMSDKVCIDSPPPFTVLVVY